MKPAWLPVPSANDPPMRVSTCAALRKRASYRRHPIHQSLRPPNARYPGDRN
ncbi:uncharacterized protein BYT42DRAFT_307298 [Radiomyces spectabilis]|uniref:uncharacterized protein n=1 Tax=Radiomyces spectabilis TaxID=64574 RepID=UPI00221EF393|nr:uncharacterized protein BYT42DRAFT_307298 [Radiomyces spectabilis]KAI8381487.1 hypothetical protein BYT42DRAFT_307298 [Radiomyces spectabilis]